MGPQGRHRGLPRRSSYARPGAASLLSVQKFVLSQQRNVHQSRVGRIKDSAVLSPASLAEKSKNDANDDEHQCHANKNADHRRIDVLETGWLFDVGYAGYYTVRLRHRDFLEEADASTVATFRLAHPRFALLSEGTGLVHVCRVSALVDMVRDLKFFLAGALVLLRFAVGASKSALFVRSTVVAKFLLAPTG